MARKRMKRWQPTQYLLEVKLINFSISQGGCNYPGQKRRTFGASSREASSESTIPGFLQLCSRQAGTPGLQFHGFTRSRNPGLLAYVQLAEEAGFILATPKGSGKRRSPGWNAGECCGQRGLGKRG